MMLLRGVQLWLPRDTLRHSPRQPASLATSQQQLDPRAPTISIRSAVAGASSRSRSLTACRSGAASHAKSIGSLLRRRLSRLPDRHNPPLRHSQLLRRKTCHVSWPASRSSKIGGLSMRPCGRASLAPRTRRDRRGRVPAKTGRDYQKQWRHGDRGCWTRMSGRAVTPPKSSPIRLSPHLSATPISSARSPTKTSRRLRSVR